MPVALALVLALAASAPPGGAIVEEIVAVVRNPPSAPPRAVTLTKLTEEARIALVSRGATEAATGPLDRAALRAALDWLVDEMLLADEASRLRIGEVERDVVLADLARFRARFATPSAYARFLAANEIAEEELLATLGRMARVRRYVESRVGRAARVDEDEVERRMRGRGTAPRSAAVRDAVRTEIVEERARAQVKELIAELRARADVRVVGSLRDGGGEG